MHLQAPDHLLKANQITQHQFLTGQTLPLGIAAHLHHGLGHVSKGKQSLLRFAFLQITEQPIEANYHQDRNCIFGKNAFMDSYHRRHRSHSQQHQKHHIAELIPKDLQRAAPLSQFQTIGARISKAAGRLGSAKPTAGAAELQKAVLSGETVAA